MLTERMVLALVTQTPTTSNILLLNYAVMWLLYLCYSIQEMKHSGELKRIYDLYWYKDLRDPEEQIFEVNMKTVSPIFIILMSGVLLATFILIYERGRNILLYNLKRFSCKVLNTKDTFHVNSEVTSKA
jgi:hypothetical protein